MERIKKFLLPLLGILLILGYLVLRPSAPPADPEPVINDPAVNTDPEPEPEPVTVPETDPEPAPEPEPVTVPETDPEPAPEAAIDEDGQYDTKDEVALYIYTYHHLPSNYMTKREARKKGWSSGPLYKVIPGMCIGGDRFGNNEGHLPDIDEDYYECDIGTLGAKSRGAKRIIYTEAGDVYYTNDHYEAFVQLYEGDS